MNHQNDITTREFCRGVVECRICGLKFCPDLEEEREHHEKAHRRIIAGGLPYEVREFIKRAAHNVLRETHGVEDASASQAREIAKRTLDYARCARAISNGIPENEFEAYMAAHLLSLD